MRITEIINDGNDLSETKMAWGRNGNKIVRKFRCSSGRLKGKLVSSPGTCFKAPDIRKRLKLKVTKARLSKGIQLKSKRTKRVNPASRRVQALNKAGRRR